MTEHEPVGEFDDPGFKAAVRRTVGRETAPPSLRARVESLLAAEAASLAAQDGNDASNGTPTEPAKSSSSSSRGSRWLTRDRAFWRTAAAAACVLIALGFMAYEIREVIFPPSPYVGGGGAGPMAVPTTLVADMARTHDTCSKLPDHHKIPGNDPVALKDKLTAGAGVTASSISLGADWTFKGAGVCKVGEKDAAHLLFARADEYVSIFSLAAGEECGYGSEEYKELYEKHVVTGFRRGNALYCVVGSSDKRDLGKNAFDPILQKMQESVAMGCMSNETMIATATASGHRD
jgi:hypothetical protein